MRRWLRFSRRWPCCSAPMLEDSAKEIVVGVLNEMATKGGTSQTETNTATVVVVFSVRGLGLT